jgi:hypothetical protein
MLELDTPRLRPGDLEDLEFTIYKLRSGLSDLDQIESVVARWQEAGETVDRDLIAHLGAFSLEIGEIGEEIEGFVKGSQLACAAMYFPILEDGYWARISQRLESEVEKIAKVPSNA